VQNSHSNRNRNNQKTFRVYTLLSVASLNFDYQSWLSPAIHAPLSTNH